MKSAWTRRFALCATMALAPAVAFGASAGDYSVCIDPGHGGSDPGAMCAKSLGCTIHSLAVNGNLEEADVVLDIGKKLRSYLQNAGFKAVYMTRDTDSFPSLAERTSYANSKGCTRFVSLHNNSCGTANSATGIETYSVSSTGTAATQSSNIQKEMLKVWSMKSRGTKTANFYVIKNTSMPATLTEMGFINNCSDVGNYLSVASMRTEAAKAHLYALQTSLGLAQGGGGTVDDGGGGGGGTATTTGKAAGVLFEDLGVGTNDMSSRLSGASVKTNDGRSATTDANGNWSFDGLAAGTYTLTGSASGYDTATKSCAVTAGGTSWCSFGLKKSSAPVAGSGTIVGVVYDVDKAAAVGNTSDASVRLPSASVENVQTGVGYALSSSGKFEFTVMDGKDYTIRASMGGYESAEKTCKGAAGAQTWCSFGLKASTATISTGAIKGVVYQNGNTSDLVYPATVKLSTGASATYTGASPWLFDGLSVGSYKVTVSAQGYDTRTYSCPTGVTAGDTATCNVELTKTAVPPGPETDAGTPVVDAGGDEDPTAPTDPLDPEGGSEGADTPRSLSDSGCGSAGDAPSAGAGILFLAMGAILVRRRSAAGGALVAASVIAAGLAGCGSEDGSKAEPTAERASLAEIAAPSPSGGALPDKTVPAQDFAMAEVRTVAPFMKVSGPVRTMVDGDDWSAPVFGPDGESIAFTRSKMKGLYLRELSPLSDGRKPVARGGVRTITEEDGAGFAPRFSRDGKRLAFRTPGQPFHAMPQRLVDREGKAARPFHLTDRLWAWATEDDAIILRQGDRETVIAESAVERFYRPFITPDSRWVIYNGLSTGVYGYRIGDGRTFFFGEGSHASASEDGRYLAFTRTEDDGTEITKGVLHVADLKPDEPVACPVVMDGEIVLHPSVSALRGAVVFSDAKGRIRMAELETNM